MAQGESGEAKPCRFMISKMAALTAAFSSSERRAMKLFVSARCATPSAFVWNALGKLKLVIGPKRGGVTAKASRHLPSLDESELGNRKRECFSKTCILVHYLDILRGAPRCRVPRGCSHLCDSKSKRGSRSVGGLEKTLATQHESQTNGMLREREDKAVSVFFLLKEHTSTNLVQHKQHPCYHQRMEVAQQEHQ